MCQWCLNSGCRSWTRQKCLSAVKTREWILSIGSCCISRFIQHKEQCWDFSGIEMRVIKWPIKLVSLEDTLLLLHVTLHLLLPMPVTHSEKFQCDTQIPCCSWTQLLQIIENFSAWRLERNRTEPLGCPLGVTWDLCSCLWKPAAARALGVVLCLYERCGTVRMALPREKLLAGEHILVAPWDGFTQEYGVGVSSPQGNWEEGTEGDKADISKGNAFSRNWCELTNVSGQWLDLIWGYISLRCWWVTSFVAKPWTLEPFLESFAAVTLCAMKTCSQKQQQLIVACFFSP